MRADATSTTAAALDLVQRGLAVFPLPPGGRRPEPGGWHDRCLTTPEQVRERWRVGDNIGVGMRASGVVGLDLDVAGDGRARLQAACDRLGEPWPDTLAVATPSSGLHVYFRVPAGWTIASVSGGRTALGPGVDVRGPGRRSGGYLIGPGSVIDGRRYAVARDAAVLPLPAWLAQLLCTPRRRPEPVGPVGPNTPNVGAHTQVAPQVPHGPVSLPGDFGIRPAVSRAGRASAIR